MKTEKVYFVNFAVCKDQIFRDVRLFDRLCDAKAFASALAYRWEIKRRVYAPFAALEDTVIVVSADPNAKYQAMARLAAKRLVAYKAS